jgi:hypothetical protein
VHKNISGVFLLFWLKYCFRKTPKIAKEYGLIKGGGRWRSGRITSWNFVHLFSYCVLRVGRNPILIIMRTLVVWNYRLKPSEPTPKISCQNLSPLKMEFQLENLEAP